MLVRGFRRLKQSSIAMPKPLTTRIPLLQLGELQFISNVIANNLKDDVGSKVATRKVDSHNAKDNEC